MNLNRNGIFYQKDKIWIIKNENDSSKAAEHLIFNLLYSYWKLIFHSKQENKATKTQEITEYKKNMKKWRRRRIRE